MIVDRNSDVCQAISPAGLYCTPGYKATLLPLISILFLIAGQKSEDAKIFLDQPC